MTHVGHGKRPFGGVVRSAQAVQEREATNAVGDYP